MGDAKYDGQAVITPKGQGIIQRHKKGNFHNQDFLVEFPNGKTHWFTENQLSFIDKTILNN